MGRQRREQRQVLHERVLREEVGAGHHGPEARTQDPATSGHPGQLEEEEEDTGSKIIIELICGF